MDELRIRNRDDLRDWLEDKPANWAQVIALRAALRALPYIAQSSDHWLRSFALLPFGALITSWMQLVDHSLFVRSDENRANARFGGPTFDFEAYKKEPIAASAADASYHSADAQSTSIHVRSDCIKGVSKAAEAFRAVSDLHFTIGEKGDQTAKTLWKCVEIDCLGLAKSSSSRRAKVAQATRRKLWSGHLPKNLPCQWESFAPKLRAIDPNYSVWADWYDRRLGGKGAAFNIPGDKGRSEDRKILHRLAEASNEDFWDKGHEHVNATLTRWLEEARARAAPPSPEGELILPKQEADAVTYGVNELGKLDRLPQADQIHLRDLPNQRRTYADMRLVALELRDEGQRLGPRLLTGMERFTRSLPEHFEDAEAYLVWRDGNTLRRLYRAHRLVADVREPDPARLEAVVAEGLGGLLDLFNNFAFGDDGIRAKDEARISPQERESAAAEFAAAKPLVEAILAAPEIATRPAHDDIKADAENAGLPADDPYAGQAQDQANRTRRNWIAGLLGGGSQALAEAYRSSKEVRSGAERAVGALIVSELFGVTSVSSPIIQFIATQAPVLQSYVAVAFSSFPHLAELIDRIVGLCQRYMKP